MLGAWFIVCWGRGLEKGVGLVSCRMAEKKSGQHSPADGQEFSEEEMKEEKEHFRSVVNAFLYYRSVKTE